MDVTLDFLKKIGKLFAKNFSGKIKVYVFGSTARRIKKEGWFALRKPEIDFLFEVEFEEFSTHATRCQEQSVDFTSGMPYDPLSAYWDYYSPKEVRFSAIAEVLKISDLLIKEIVENLDTSVIDTLMLPFDWKEMMDILKAINSRDPDFSDHISEDILLVFEKQ